MTVSLATDNWFIAKPIIKREGVNLTSDGKFQGEVYFGLFNGKKKLDSGFGMRSFDITIICKPSKNVCMFTSKSREEGENELLDILQMNATVKDTLKNDPSLMIYGLWLFTILSVGLSMLFGLVGGIFAIVNSVTTPVEAIVGILGLYLWNGMGALFSLTAIISWVVQYYLKLKVNIMSKEELTFDWDSKDRTNFGYSFYLVIVALVLYVNNIITVLIIFKQAWRKKAPKTEVQKNAEGVIMLY